MLHVAEAKRIGIETRELCTVIISQVLFLVEKDKSECSFSVKIPSPGKIGRVSKGATCVNRVHLKSRFAFGISVTRKIANASRNSRNSTRFRGPLCDFYPVSGFCIRTYISALIFPRSIRKVRNEIAGICLVHRETNGSLHAFHRMIKKDIARKNTSHRQAGLSVVAREKREGA